MKNNDRFMLLKPFLLGLSIALATPVISETTSSSQPDQLSALALQFVDLNKVNESIKTDIERKQFLAFIDEIRKDLQEFEERTRRVYYGIPRNTPDRNEKKSLKRKLNKLDDSLEDIIAKLQVFKQSVSSAGLYADESVQIASKHQSIAIFSALESLENLKDDDDAWDGEKLKQMFAESIKTLSLVNAKITEFQMGIEQE